MTHIVLNLNPGAIALSAAVLTFDFGLFIKATHDDDIAWSFFFLLLSVYMAYRVSMLIFGGWR